MGDETDIRQGTLTLMVLKTLDVMGPRAARRGGARVGADDRHPRALLRPRGGVARCA